jgi:hypothetical protein
MQKTFKLRKCGMPKYRNNPGDQVQSPMPGGQSRIKRIMRPQVFSRMHRMLRFSGRFSIVLAFKSGNSE